jgi:hypothetical protein
MRRLCTEGACSYSGRAVRHAVRVAMGVELRPMLKSMDSPSNPKVAVIVTGTGLRATSKGAEQPTGPYDDPGSALGGNTEGDCTAVSRRRSSQTPTVMGGTR